MIKYILISFVLIISLILFRLTLIYLTCIYHKKSFKKSTNINPKILFFESIVFTFIFAFSLWLIDNYLSKSNFILFFLLLLISLVPSYNFIIVPIKYLFFKKEYKKNEKLTNLINSKGYKYNIIMLKGDVINAYATGVLPFSKTILIGESLLNKMSEDNLISIIYHEIGHLKQNHLAKLYLINLLLTFLSLMLFFIRQDLLVKFESSLFEPFSIFVLGLLIGILIWYIPGKIQYKFEFKADLFASKISGVMQFEKALLELDTISNGIVSKGGITHPNLSKRIENIHKNNEK